MGGVNQLVGSMMTRTAEQCCALVEAIALSSSVAALDELRQAAQREYGRDVCGSFVELLIELRQQRLDQQRLDQQRRHPSRTA